VSRLIAFRARAAEHLKDKTVDAVRFATTILGECNSLIAAGCALGHDARCGELLVLVIAGAQI
jgi:hypothetical protein